MLQLHHGFGELGISTPPTEVEKGTGHLALAIPERGESNRFEGREEAFHTVGGLRALCSKRPRWS